MGWKAPALPGARIASVRMDKPGAFECSTVGIDIAESVFQVHAIDAEGNVVVRRQLRRQQMLKFFAEVSPCLIGIEACGTVHYWARELPTGRGTNAEACRTCSFSLPCFISAGPIGSRNPLKAGRAIGYPRGLLSLWDRGHCRPSRSIQPIFGSNSLKPCGRPHATAQIDQLVRRASFCHQRCRVTGLGWRDLWASIWSSPNNDRSETPPVSVPAICTLGFTDVDKPTHELWGSLTH